MRVFRMNKSSVPMSQSPLDAKLPIISVIITCYNLGRYIEEAVESVSNQTFKSLELIIVDDGSHDEATLRTLSRLSERGIRLVRQENQGVGAALNYGIRLSGGKYLCALDSDDRLRPELLEKAVRILDGEPEVGIVACFIQEFGESDKVLRPKECDLSDMTSMNRIGMPAAVFRRQAWEKVGGYHGSPRGLEDWGLWLGIMELGYRMRVIPEILFEYRVRADSMYHSRTPEEYGLVWRNLVIRHEATYKRYLLDLVEAIGIELAQSYKYFRELETANRWLDDQRAKWQKEAECQTAMVAEQQGWIAELENGKAWLEQQCANWQGEAERQAAIAQALQARIDELKRCGDMARK